MMNTELRKYNFKNEEVSMISRFVHSNLKRDLPLFTAFSPRFNEEFLTNLDKQILEANSLIVPRGEIDGMKAATAKLYNTMDSLTEPLNRLSGYLSLAGSTISTSQKDFGIVTLRKKMASRDAEAVVQQLQIINTKIEQNKVALTEIGISEEDITFFVEIRDRLIEENLQQYDVIESRKILRQNYQKVLNELYLTIREICNIGKILFKNKDSVKLQEYTFTQMIKRIRSANK
jgi:hypothetical protein